MAAIVSSLLFGVAFSEIAFPDFSIKNGVVDGAPQLLYVEAEDLFNKSHQAQVAEALASGHAVLFDQVDPSALKQVLSDANFPTSPGEPRHYFMAHAYQDDNGLNQFLTKEYFHYVVEKRSIASQDGLIEEISNFTVENFEGPLHDQYVKDVLDYNKYCVGDRTGCKAYMDAWNTEYNFTDQSGMVPSNGQSCWGQIQHQTYVDDKTTTFSSLIPFNFYIYAEANSATEKLQSMILYIIAEGLHSQTVACNSDGCRGNVHREIWVNITAHPTVSYTTSDYHWLYSKPQTQNNVNTVTTGVSDTTTIGESASFSDEGASIGFSASYSFTNSYSDSVQVQDFDTVEDTSASSGAGKWISFEAEPTNIQKYPLENFGNDWTEWYASTDSNGDVGGCVVIEGPDLAFNSQQTSNAIKWQADPNLINYSQKSLGIYYFVQMMANVDTIWCPDYTGKPTNVCNSQSGGQHHCAQWSYVRATPTWTSNVIQSMNNIKT